MRYLERRIHVSYDPLREVLLTVGGSEGIDMAFRAMLNPGDEVLIPQPSYVSYEPCWCAGRRCAGDHRAEGGE